MVFERASSEDIEQLTALRIAYLTEDYGALDEKVLENMRRDLPAYFMQKLNQDIFAYVARSKQEIVSVALLLVVEKPMSPAFINGKTGTVLNVYTEPEHRRHGCAKKCMDMLLAHASGMGLCVVELKATEDGYPLYQSMGFKDVVSKYHQMEWRQG